MPPRLRRASLADLPALMALERACYPPGVAFPEDTYRAYLHWDRAVNLVHEAEGFVSAFGGAVAHDEWGVGEVYTLNVHPDARGRGVGRLLLAALEARLREAGCDRVVLEVNVANAPAIRLYETAGYRRLERLPGYYAETGYGEKDAYRYGKLL